MKIKKYRLRGGREAPVLDLPLQLEQQVQQERLGGPIRCWVGVEEWSLAS